VKIIQDWEQLKKIWKSVNLEIIKTIIFIQANGIKALVGRVTVTLPLSFTTQGGGGVEILKLGNNKICHIYSASSCLVWNKGWNKGIGGQSYS
jgi:hypothetical protein